MICLVRWVPIRALLAVSLEIEAVLRGNFGNSARFPPQHTHTSVMESRGRRLQGAVDLVPLTYLDIDL